MRKIMQSTSALNRTHGGGTFAAFGVAAGLALGLGVSSASYAGAGEIFSEEDMITTEGGGIDNNTASVAINPTNPSLVEIGYNRWRINNIDPDGQVGTIDLYRTNCGTARSIDGGLTWSNNVQWSPPSDDTTEGDRPTVAFDGDGNTYGLCNYFFRDNLAGGATDDHADGRTNGTLYVRRHGPGETFNTNPTSNLAMGDPGGGLDTDHGHMAVDKGDGSHNYGNIYVYRTRFPGHKFVMRRA